MPLFFNFDMKLYHWRDVADVRVTGENIWP